MTTMLETLDETVEAYTSETRAAYEQGGCSYLTDDGRMCAIGRCMLSPGDFMLFQSVRDIADSLDEGIDSVLKPEYRGYPLAFWEALQDLHDTKSNWDERGLTALGREAADEIAEDHPFS